ncbi:hypothetical protein [Roseovarius sp. 2305UL8-3]|uniref:hypothetical protein n=1 Tax=Roseovarius conchicola TaxID=3121636 RepID=UPI0035271D6B
MRLFACLTAMFLALTPVAYAQEVAPNREDIIRLLARMDEFVPLRQDFIRMGFQGENLELALDQHARVFGDRDIGGFVADRLIGAFSGSLPGAAETGGLLGPLIDRGIGHVPTRDLVYFYRVENTVFRALPYRECGLAVKQRLSDRRLADATARAAARLNTPALREYYRIQYNAARLGLTREAVRLSPDRTAQIEARIGEELFKRTGDGEARNLIRMFENPRGVTNRQACEAGRTIMQTVMTLEGRELRDALIYFSSP